MKRLSVVIVVAVFKCGKSLQSEQVWIGWLLRPAVNAVLFFSWWPYQRIQYKSGLSDVIANLRNSSASCMRCHEASGRPPIFYQQLRHLWLLHPPEPPYFQTQGGLRHSRMQWDLYSRVGLSYLALLCIQRFFQRGRYELFGGPLPLKEVASWYFLEWLNMINNINNIHTVITCVIHQR